MAGKIKNKKVSNVPDGANTDLVRPSDNNNSLQMTEGRVGMIAVRSNAGDGWELVDGLTLSIYNNTGAQRVAGDVVALDVVDAGGAVRVILDDTLSSRRDFVVVLETIANAATGMALKYGGPVTAKSTGAIATLRWVRKSATTLTIEDAGVGIANSPPMEAIGYSIEAAAGGTCKIMLLGRVGVRVDAADIVSGTIATARLGSGSATGSTFLAGDSTWKSAGFDPETHREFYDDFLGTDDIAAAPPVLNRSFAGFWKLNNGGDAAANNYGVSTWQIRGEASLGHGNRYLCRDKTPAFDLFSGAKNPDLKMRWAQITTGAGTRRIGLCGAAMSAADPTSGIYFRHSAGGNLIAVCRSGGTESTLDTAVAAAAGTFRQGRMKKSGSSVEVFVDQVSKGTISSNVPTGNLGLGFDGGAQTSDIEVDYVHVREDR